MSFTIHPGPLDRALEHACVRLEQSRFADALWARRPDVWTSDASIQQAIANRLGWLRATEASEADLPRVTACARAVRAAGFTEVVLLGMGGSSLAAEVLRAVMGGAPGFPQFRMLDSVDPDAVRDAMARPATSLFVVASKSGSTIEVSALAAEAERRVRAAGVSHPGSHFLAITDDNSPLHRRAVDGRFRDVFINASDVGGRFSALTLFGLVPAALMGIDPGALLSSTRAMAEACRLADPRRNPGLALGAALAAAAGQGRDKLTLRLPPSLAPLGLWIEQLVAESTGKDGKGIVPIAGEPAAIARGDDRIIVEINGDAAAVDEPRVTLDDSGLGAEFFRWEVATATAGFLLGVNPFDEPNVQQAKDATRALLDAYSRERRLPQPDAHHTIRVRSAGPLGAEGGGPAEVQITLSAAAQSALGGGTIAVGRLLRRGDYFALLAYLPPDEPRAAVILERARVILTTQTGSAGMVGFGPRYLHSTGQLHKGGPNSGVFVVIAADTVEDLAVPGQPYSFGILETAQALGDFQALDRLGRRAMLLRLPNRDHELLQRVTEIITVPGPPPH